MKGPPADEKLYFQPAFPGSKPARARWAGMIRVAAPAFLLLASACEKAPAAPAPDPAVLDALYAEAEAADPAAAAPREAREALSRTASTARSVARLDPARLDPRLAERLLR